MLTPPSKSADSVLTGADTRPVSDRGCRGLDGLVMPLSILGALPAPCSLFGRDALGKALCITETPYRRAWCQQKGIATLRWSDVRSLMVGHMHGRIDLTKALVLMGIALESGTPIPPQVALGFVRRADGTWTGPDGLIKHLCQDVPKAAQVLDGVTIGDAMRMLQVTPIELRADVGVGEVKKTESEGFSREI